MQVIVYAFDGDATKAYVQVPAAKPVKEIVPVAEAVTPLVVHADETKEV